jgi:hypothetical protein
MASSTTAVAGVARLRSAASRVPNEATLRQNGWCKVFIAIRVVEMEEG